MRKLLLVGLSMLLFLMLSGTSFALNYSTNVLWSGTNVPGSDRQDIAHAIGAPDNDFLSIGIDGIAAFEFGLSFDITASVVEVTWGNRDNYPEYADVYVGNTAFSLNTGDYSYVTQIQNNVAQNTIDLTGILGSPFQYILVVDRTAHVSGGISNGDGFDIDAVGVSPVPEPATMVLLGIGLVGLAGLGRKKIGSSHKRVQ